jgi:hypothetical protein
MGDWLLNTPALAMAAVILAACYLFTAGLYLLITALAVGERARAFKAVSAGMLSPMAVVFALLVGFLAVQVWGDLDRANTAVNREASALRAVVLLASDFPGEPERRIRELVRRHIQEAVTHDWPAMSRGNATLTLVPASLTEALRVTLTLDPKGEGQLAAQREMIASLESALEARRLRIVLSHSSVNWVKWTALLLQAALTLVTIGLVHSDNRLANRIIMGIFATSVGVALTLVAAHSRPFAGQISVRPAVLLQVMPEAGPAPPLH